MFSGKNPEASCKSWNTKYAGKEAFTTFNNKGYQTGTLERATFLAHRVAWAIHYGEWPAFTVDHKDGNPSNNRLQNLRHVTRSVNQRNQKLSASNSSGVVGVCWNTSANKWKAHIYVTKGGKSKRKHLGYFSKKADAIRVRKQAEKENGYTSRVS